MSSPTVGNLLGLLRLCAGIDARRPASWIALAGGGCAGWWYGAPVTAAAGGMALVSAALAAVAAIGDLPLDLCLVAGRTSGRGPTAAPGGVRGRIWACIWAGERACWPLAGLVAAALVGGWRGAALGNVPPGLAGLMLAAGTLVACRLAGATAADAASLSIVIAAASAAVGAVAAAWAALSSCLGVAVATWLALGGLAWAWARAAARARGRTATDSLMQAGLPGRAVRGGDDLLHLDPLPVGGPARRILVRLAMGTALVAMAGVLVLATPEATGRGTAAWGLLSAAWFVGLAVPSATLLDGVGGVGGWDRLYRTAARAGRAERRQRLGSLPLGGPRFAGGVASTVAAILGWPALVCAGLSLPTPSKAWPALAIVIGLVAAAALLAAAAALGGAAAASRETVFAAVLAGAAVASAVAVSRAFPDAATLPVACSSPNVARAWRLASLPTRQGWQIGKSSCCSNASLPGNLADRVEKSCPEERYMVSRAG